MGQLLLGATGGAQIVIVVCGLYVVLIDTFRRASRGRLEVHCDTTPECGKKEKTVFCKRDWRGEDRITALAAVLCLTTNGLMTIGRFIR